jgi:hypothetical protein
MPACRAGAEGEGEMKIELYRGTEDQALRMVVERGVGLPRHVDPKDWKIMTAAEMTVEEQALAEDDATIADIRARGFSFYKRV